MDKIVRNQSGKSLVKVFRNIWLLSIVVFVFAFVYLDGFKNTTDKNILTGVVWLLALVVVGTICFVIWIFSIMRKRTRLLVLLLLVVLYSVGVIVANIKAKPFLEALAIVQEAEGPVKQQLIETIDKDVNKGVEIEKKYNDLYAKAATINLKDYPILQSYIKENLQLSTEILTHDEKILSGQLKITQVEAYRNLDEFTLRRKDILNRYGSYARIHTWMKIFLVGITPSDFTSKVVSE